jgi:hypothetical protein
MKMRKPSTTFRKHLQDEARKSGAKSTFERRYNSEMHADESDNPDAVGYRDTHDRTKNTLGDPYKGLHALPTPYADPPTPTPRGPQNTPITPRGREAVRNFNRSYLRD